MGMTQPALWYEDYAEALRDDVRALGGAKSVGVLLWPEKDADAARNKLNDCCNPERRDRLSTEQEHLLIKRAREVRNYSALLYYTCDETGFDRPSAKNVQDETAQLQREFIDSVRRSEIVAKRLEALTRSPMQQAVQAVK